MGPRTPLSERIRRNTEFTETCWLWTGYVGRDGYVNMKIDDRMFKAHRVAWELVNGPIPDGLQIDHICQVRHCVRPDHLRLATHAQNNQYHRSLNQANTSGYRNVSWYPRTGKWRARIQVEGVVKYLGCYETAEEADRVAREARAKYFEFHKEDAA